MRLNGQRSNSNGRHYALVPILLASLTYLTEGAICENWDEEKCPTSNDGGCACIWTGESCTKGTDCFGMGITSIKGGGKGEDLQVGITRVVEDDEEPMMGTTAVVVNSTVPDGKLPPMKGGGGGGGLIGTTTVGEKKPPPPKGGSGMMGTTVVGEEKPPPPKGGSGMMGTTTVGEHKPPMRGGGGMMNTTVEPEPEPEPEREPYWYEISGSKWPEIGEKISVQYPCMQCRRGFMPEESALMDACRDAGFEMIFCNCFDIYCSGLPTKVPTEKSTFIKEEGQLKPSKSRKSKRSKRKESRKRKGKDKKRRAGKRSKKRSKKRRA